MEYGTPPPVEEPHCYSMCISESSISDEKNGAVQVTNDLIRNLLVEHMRGVGGRLQLLDDLETGKICIDSEELGNYKLSEINALLLQASFLGRGDLIPLLHKCGADLNHSEQELGLTALHLCAYSNSMTGVKYLITNGANINSRKAHTPFHYAAFGDSVDVAQHFKQQGFSEESPLGDESVLHSAARSNALNVLNLLAKDNPALNVKDKNGYAPIHHVADRGDSTCLEVLLASGCQVDLASKKGDTALHLAAEAGCVENVELLLKNGASAGMKNSRGHTPLHLAARSHCLECVEVLLHKANIDRSILFSILGCWRFFFFTAFFGF